MNVVREIDRINQRELELGGNASWHDDWKDSAYIFVGGLDFGLTEGDVITIFSQYGEVMDIDMPRDKETGKSRGFAFLMYEDQRSTILAVDNLNGAKVLERTIRVDHTRYEMRKKKDDDGQLVEVETQRLNAKPELIEDDEPHSDSSASTGADIDPEDPMRDYLIEQRREEKARQKKPKKSKEKRKHKDETPEERRARKERKREKKKAESSGVKAVEELLSRLEADRHSSRRSGSPSPRRNDGDRSRSPSPRRRNASSPSHRDRYGGDSSNRGARPRHSSRSRERR